MNGYLSLCVSLGADWYSVSHPLTAGIASSPPAILSLIHTYIYIFFIDVWYLCSNSWLQPHRGEQRFHLSKRGTVCWGFGLGSPTEVVSSDQTHQNDTIPPRLGLTGLPGQKTQSMSQDNCFQLATACCMHWVIFLKKNVISITALRWCWRSSRNKCGRGVWRRIQEKIIVSEAYLSWQSKPTKEP